MFVQPTPLNSALHQNLRFLPVPGFAFAKDLGAIPILAAECAHIARQMPIVFPLQTGNPLALVSIDGKTNAHVNAKGQWQGADYVPAHLRRYPFLLQEMPQNGAEKSFALLFDAAAPHFHSEMGERLLDDAGQPGAMLQSVQGMLAAMHGDLQRTLALVNQLDALGLLREEGLSISVPQAEPVHIKGFRIINREAFALLEGEHIKALQASNALELVYAHFISLNLLQNGWLVRQLHHSTPVTPNLDAFFSSNEGSLRFN